MMVFSFLNRFFFNLSYKYFIGNSVFLWGRNTKYKRILRSYFLYDLLSFSVLGMDKRVFSKRDLFAPPT